MLSQDDGKCHSQLGWIEHDSLKLRMHEDPHEEGKEICWITYSWDLDCDNIHDVFPCEYVPEYGCDDRPASDWVFADGVRILSAQMDLPEGGSEEDYVFQMFPTEDCVGEPAVSARVEGQCVEIDGQSNCILASDESGECVRRFWQDDKCEQGDVDEVYCTV